MGRDATVFVVDDDSGVRKLLVSEIEAAGFRAECFASAEEFLADYEEPVCGCILLDLQLPGISGLQLLETLRSRSITLPVIMLTAFGDVPAAVRSMQLGAKDFIQKPFDHDDLLAKISCALQEDRARRSRKVLTDAVRGRLAALTARETDVLKGLVAGKASKHIAADLGLSQRTVENHRCHLLGKTGAANTADLVRMSLTAGMP